MSQDHKSNPSDASSSANHPRPADGMAVLLIAHGSRRSEANQDLVRLANMVRARSQYPIVEIAYLELASPTIPEGANNCVHRGARNVRMLPYFLSAGSHVTEDLEKYRAELEKKYPDVVFEVCAPLGLHPLMVEIVLSRLGESNR